jgi:rare lipoprotein A
MTSRAVLIRSLSAILATITLAAITTPANQPQDSPQKSPAAKAKPEPERGYAAFYSHSLEGHKTACGGTYSATQLTAAHRKLPCGAKLRVTNLRNGKTVRVTVNDRGPSSPNRIIDLSYAAAQALNFTKQGITLVKLEVLGGRSFNSDKPIAPK